MKSKMRITLLPNQLIQKCEQSLAWTFGLSLLLSWFYGLCSQIIIPLPFNLVPLSIQPLPIFAAALIFGWPAAYACFLFIVQGACGAPFFAGMQSGIARLMGPTGGYLIGFLIAAFFLASVKNYKTTSLFFSLLKIIIANGITFSCGLLSLARFVSPAHVLAAGLYPFVLGDFVIKASLLFIIMKKMYKKA